MHGRLLVFILVLLSIPLPASAKQWREYENCTLMEDKDYDGDSFHVRYKSPTSKSYRYYLFRLYFVDAPEKDRSIPERVTEQAAYWGISENDVVRLGKDAKKFTEKFLADGFTAHSRLSDAMGRSKKDRDYAIIRVGKKDLGEELVRNGLGRIHGKGIDLHDGTSQKLVWWRLKSAEREAQEAKRGGWGMDKVSAETNPFEALNEPPEITEQDRILDQSIAVYSLADPNRQVGILQRGAELHVIQAESPTMVRIRFTTGSGKIYEAQCRIIDLGL